MVFNRKGNFFLNLDEKAPDTAATVAPVAAAPKAVKDKPQPAAAPSLSVAASAGAAPAAAKAPAPAAAAAAAPTGSALTTAEAIAAELAAAQAARPAASTATFAPEALVPGTALPMRRRRGGANLAGFRGMAGSLFGKS